MNENVVAFFDIAGAAVAGIVVLREHVSVCDGYAKLDARNDCLRRISRFSGDSVVMGMISDE